MKIWLDHLSGDVEIINGLNHYIGMKHIKPEMFPEFGYMGYVLGALIAIGMLPVLFGKTRFLYIFVAILFIAAGLGIYDFYRWGYDYGHNLDPKAAISVPGMTYQPPVIGYKSLLNFVAYSGPEKGGWILIGTGAAATILLLAEIKRGRKVTMLGFGNASKVALLLMPFLLVSCEAEKVTISYGKDDCAECKMLIMDQHYGTAFITEKGKVFKFDDTNCLITFMNGTKAPSGKAMVINFSEPNQFLPVEQAFFLKHTGLRTPMNSSLAAFSDKESAQAKGQELGGESKVLSWEEVRSQTEACTCAP